MTRDEFLAAIQKIRQQMDDRPRAMEEARLAAIARVEELERQIKAATTMEQLNALAAEVERVMPTYYEAISHVA